MSSSESTVGMFFIGAMSAAVTLGILTNDNELYTIEQVHQADAACAGHGGVAQIEDYEHARSMDSQNKFHRYMTMTVLCKDNTIQSNVVTYDN